MSPSVLPRLEMCAVFRVCVCCHPIYWTPVLHLAVYVERTSRGYTGEAGRHKQELFFSETCLLPCLP